MPTIGPVCGHMHVMLMEDSHAYLVITCIVMVFFWFYFNLAVVFTGVVEQTKE